MGVWVTVAPVQPIARKMAQGARNFLNTPQSFLVVSVLI
jgi:hypothetical protein